MGRQLGSARAMPGTAGRFVGGEWIGMVELDDGEWDVCFGPLRLGRFHERTMAIEDAHGRQHRRPY